QAPALIAWGHAQRQPSMRAGFGESPRIVLAVRPLPRLRVLQSGGVASGQDGALAALHCWLAESLNAAAKAGSDNPAPGPSPAGRTLLKSWLKCLRRCHRS